MVVEWALQLGKSGDPRHRRDMIAGDASQEHVLVLVHEQMFVEDC